MKEYKSVVNLSVTEIEIIGKFHFNRLRSAYRVHKNAGKELKLKLVPMFYKACTKHFFSIMFN